MIAVILAGGYAKRLWPLTLGKPKPLLPIAGRCVIDRVLDWVATSSQPMSRIIVLTNSKFENQFQAWVRSRNERVDIVPDGSLSEDEKPGAIGALSAVAPGINEAFLVVAGDCVYPGRLSSLLAAFHEKKAPVVGVYRARNLEEVKRGSTAELDPHGIIMKYVEKPANPTSDLVGAVVYALPIRIRDRIVEYSAHDFSRDEPGRFIEWLCRVEKVHAHLLDGIVWDIGTLKAYEEVNRIFAAQGL